MKSSSAAPSLALPAGAGPDQRHNRLVGVASQIWAYQPPVGAYTGSEAGQPVTATPIN